MEFEVRVAKGARRSGKGGGKWWPLRRRWRPLQTCNLVIFEGMLKMGQSHGFHASPSRESTHCTPDRVLAFMIDRDTSNGTVGIPMALRTEIEDREPPK